MVFKTTFGTVQKWSLRPLLDRPKGGLKIGILLYLFLDVDDTTWVDPCQLLEQLEMTKGQVNFEELVRLNLNKWNYCVKKWMSHVSYASWNYVTDLTEENKQKVSRLVITITCL